MPSAPIRGTKARRRRRPASLMLTPMIDVVFLLMAFFIFSLSYSSETTSPAVTPPHGGDQGLPTPAAETLLVEIDRSGRVLGLSGPVHSTDPNLQDTLEAALARAGSHDTLVIRADRDTPYEAVDRVLAWCRNRKIHSIALRLRTEQP